MSRHALYTWSVLGPGPIFQFSDLHFGALFSAHIHVVVPKSKSTGKHHVFRRRSLWKSFRFHSLPTDRYIYIYPYFHVLSGKCPPCCHAACDYFERMFATYVLQQMSDRRQAGLESGAAAHAADGSSSFGATCESALLRSAGAIDGGPRCWAMDSRRRSTRNKPHSLSSS